MAFARPLCLMENGNSPEVAHSDEIKQLKLQGLIDFQVHPLRKSEADDDPMAQFDLSDTALRTELVVPKFISRYNAPRDYRFRPSQADTDKKNRNVRFQNRQRETTSKSYVQYDDPNAVPSAPLQNTQSSSVSFQKHPVTVQLRSYFAKRPIWNTSAILANLKDTDSEVVLRLLPTVAYRFISGAWRNIWIRYGFDPRKSPESRIYQMIDFRIPKEIGRILEIIESAKHQDAFDHTFSSAPIKLGTMYQICDLNDAEIRKIVSTSTVNDKPTKTEGWFHPADFRKIRICMKRRLKQWATEKEAGKELTVFPVSDTAITLQTSFTPESPGTRKRAAEADEKIENERSVKSKVSENISAGEPVSLVSSQQSNPEAANLMALAAQLQSTSNVSTDSELRPGAMLSLEEENVTNPLSPGDSSDNEFAIFGDSDDD
eukprot:1007687_1